MLLLMLAMAAILVTAVVVVAYVAYPHRGEDLPVAPWLGEAMKRGVDALPTLDEEIADEPRAELSDVLQSDQPHR